VGKPAILHATTNFLASNLYSGQYPKPLQQWFPKWAVHRTQETLGVGEAEMGGWGAIGDAVNNYNSVV